MFHPCLRERKEREKNTCTCFLLFFASGSHLIHFHSFYQLAKSTKSYFCPKMRLVTLLLLCNFVESLMSGNGLSLKNFKLPSFMAPPSTSNTKNISKSQQEQLLLKTISNTSNGKTASLETQRKVLSIVSSLEESFPAPPLNSILQPGSILDGTWYLQYTSPSDLNDDNSSESSYSKWKIEKPEENIEVKSFNAKGSVSAAGIEVDVTYQAPKQIFDLSNLTVRNEVILGNNLVTKVIVGGPFRLSEKKDNRAVVSFLFGNLDLQLFGSTFQLDLASIFKFLALVRGTDESGWLETTYLSDSIRVGRGNKGTMFILTRSEKPME